MVKIGAITIGQSPRDDIIRDIRPLLGEEIQLLQAGGLDGLSREEIEAFTPQPGDYVLISKLRDGSSVVFAERYILPRLQACIDRLEEDGAQMILFLCTGEFPTVFHSRVPLIFPCKLLNGLVPALAGREKIAVVAPTQEQVAQTEQKWAAYVQEVTVLPASPYGPQEELERAARQIAALDVDLVVMDCIGYTMAMKEKVRQLSGKPVLLSRTLAARTAMELLS